MMKSEVSLFEQFLQLTICLSPLVPSTVVEYIQIKESQGKRTQSNHKMLRKQNKKPRAKVRGKIILSIEYDNNNKKYAILGR